MNKKNKFKELLKNKEVVVSGLIVIALVIIAIIQFIF